MSKPSESSAANFAECALEEPIIRGDTAIGSITVRRPTTGELRGLNLADLLKLDVAALITLIPRVSNPTLVAHEVEGMSPCDIASVGAGILGFFMTAQQRSEAGIA